MLTVTHSFEAERPRPAAVALGIERLRVEYPTVAGAPKVAVRDLDLSIRPGEILSLVGESGAGKTTLARSILNLPPSPGRVAAGSVRFGGVDLLQLAERELQRIRGRDLSMVVPNPRGELNPLLPVGDQIATIARVHLGKDKKTARAMALDMLRAVQIPDPERRMKAYPHELSGGMAQRVVIAMALVCSPKFIISDDATSGLDVTVQAQILDLLRRLAIERHSAMLFITRDVGITAHFCDRVAVIYDGEIMEIAPRESFFLAPRHPYTVMLLAAFSHNPRLRRGWTVSEAQRRTVDAAVGCAYADRCPRAQAVCRRVKPPLGELAPGHFARCHFPVERS
ncbi:MAG TPA: ABC transporter ATP-binding protein [Burkholderiales bacterium]|nr:ABC transporter ATP-binding protein [Burkholderiales bacterium]